ncbi:MAG: hypothetical protein AAGA81_08715 [Acidobacteriota bacterium]
MEWKVISYLSLCGVAFGLATVFAVISGHEYWIAALLLVSIGKVAVLLARQRPARNSFASGAGVVLAALWTQALLMPEYLSNNPEYAAPILPLGLSERWFTLVFSPVGALGGGLIAAFGGAVCRWPSRRARASRSVLNHSDRNEP